MPIYEYKCEECGVGFEALTPLSAAHEIRGCPECGKKSGKRILSTASVGISMTGGHSPSFGGGRCDSGGGYG